MKRHLCVSSQVNLEWNWENRPGSCSLKPDSLEHTWPNIWSCISPIRERKLACGNHLEPAFLCQTGFMFRFTLEEALRDWRTEQPQNCVGQ